MTLTTTVLGGTDVKVAKVAHGLMYFTWRNPVTDDETAFESIKAGLDLAGPGEKIVLNSAEFYGFEPPTANLELLSRFFAKYPDYADKALLVVKGGSVIGSMEVDSSLKNLRRSAVDIQKALGPHKKLDVFDPARLDGKHSIEEIATSLKTLQEEGLFSYIGLSEVNADTLRTAHKIAPIALVENECSPWTYDAKTQAVIETANELGINVLAYSPLGRGFLTGKMKPTDLGQDDMRRIFPRFESEAVAQNQKIVDELTAIASKKGVTNAQLCIAWVASLGDLVIPLPGSSRKERTLENFAGANVKLTTDEKAELDAAVKNFTVVGERYPEFALHHLLK